MTITGINTRAAPARRGAGSSWAIFATFLCLLLVMLVLLSQPWRGHETLAYLLTYVLPPLLAGSIVLTRLRATPPSRTAWSLLASGLFLTAGGEALEAALRLGLPLAGGALLRDALWFAYYPVVGTALLLLTREAAPRPLLQSWLEAAMAGGATLAVGLLLITDLWELSSSGLPPLFPLADADHEPDGPRGEDAFSIVNNQSSRQRIPRPTLGRQPQLPVNFPEIQHRKNSVHDQQGKNESENEKKNIARRVVGRHTDPDRVQNQEPSGSRGTVFLPLRRDNQ